MVNLCTLPEFLSDQEPLDISTLTMLILAEREKSLNLRTELMFERQKNKQLEEFIEKMFRNQEKIEEKKEENIIVDPELTKVKVGTYPEYIRRIKIKSYKKKLKKYRERVVMSRDFKGRSLAAKMKPRFNGKFARKITQN